MEELNETTFADTFGVALSGACVVHCLVVPFLVPFLPLLAVFEDRYVHTIMAVLLLGIGVFAFFRGYRVHHQKSIVIAGLLGVALLFAAILLPDHPHDTHTAAISTESLLTSIGGAILIAAHLFNIRHCRCSLSENDCSCEHGA